VQDAALVRVLRGTGQRLDESGGDTCGRPALLEPRRQVSPVAQFQGEEEPAVVLADLVDGHDVGVFQAGKRLGLATEPFELLGPGIGSAEEHLQGDDAVQGRVPRPIHHGQAAAA
jgi:hypothetical protein